ncbi:hypothetical protein EV421DRAFT_1911350 [Armillaria borealis]|uniref:Fungal-type protein kinase domain-containing protein n=1 Tax=Armillaria borealis TaxID=47425 RepID=A0AA39MFI8_9AGAR|nr:hypothetical protein EV421DRAFT_1911350 [Armillaria borealis]
MTTPRNARLRLGIRISAPEQQSRLQETLTPISFTDDTLDVETWVQLVWGLSKEEIKKVFQLTVGWRLKKSAMDRYITTLSDSKKREPVLYPPFKNILDNIIDRLSELEQLPDQQPQGRTMAPQRRCPTRRWRESGYQEARLSFLVLFYAGLYEENPKPLGLDRVSHGGGKV